MEIFWDISGFYEAVSIRHLARSIQARGMPLTPAALSIWGHGARTFMKIRGCYEPKGLTPGQSVATGCHSSTSLARSVLAGPVEEAMAAEPQVEYSIHVDDIKQQAAGSEEEVVQQCMNAGAALVSSLQAKGFQLSSKSCILSSSQSAAKKLKMFFTRSFGVKLNCRR